MFKKDFQCIEQELFDFELPKNSSIADFKAFFAGSYGCFRKAMPWSGPSAQIEFLKSETVENGVKNFYEFKKGDDRFLVEVLYEYFSTNRTVRQTVKITNNGEKSAVLENLSSALIKGFGVNGVLPWHSPDRFIIHYCRMAWQGEAQWEHISMPEAGLYPTTVHDNKQYFEIASKGSWSTSRYYPVIILEDTETGKSFYMELECKGSWSLTVMNPGTGYAKDGYLAVEASSADIDNDGWFVELKPGDSYTANSCVYGYIDGGFEEAVAELTLYKREDNRAPFKDGKILTAYNTYMNGIWSQPTAESLIPLIDAAADLGLEVFCIDAGWFRCYDDPTKNAIGDYVVAEDRFKGYGLKGVLQYMKDKGMIPGIWLEIECCEDKGGFGYTLSENCLCRRNGTPLGGTRSFYNLRDKAVREHLHRVIDMLCDMGIGFIKNDYNQTTGAGFEGNGSLANAYRECFDALISFFDEVRAKHPELIIENCGSGAMRCDHTTLKHFELQSSSDQELYYRYPSVASGSLAIMPPEKAGLWSFPYPCLGYQQTSAKTDEFWKKRATDFADGEETVFNMTTAILGNLYMSGRLDKCDNFNKKLIKEGIRYYKKNRDSVINSVPVYPTGTFTINDEGMFATGVLDKKKGKLILAVWNINAHKKTAVIDLSKYTKATSKAKVAYPASLGDTECVFHSANRKLSVKLPDKKYSARIIEIKI